MSEMTPGVMLQNLWALLDTAYIQSIEEGFVNKESSLQHFDKSAQTLRRHITSSIDR